MALSPQDSGQINAFIANAEAVAIAAAHAAASAEFGSVAQRELLLASRVANLEYVLAVTIWILGEQDFDLPDVLFNFLEKRACT